MQKSTSITLKPSKAKLLTYTKEAIGVVGSTEVTVDWQKIFSVKSDVFKDDLGTVKGMEATIHIDPEATPLFHKARRVRFAVKEKVEAQLERLHQQGTTEPVQFSE